MAHERLPDVMTETEWAAFIGTFNEKAPTGLRNKALFTLMHDAGLRTCEVIGLKTADVKRVDVDGVKLTCLRLQATKGGKHRNVYLTEEADRLLHAWLDVRAARALGRRKHVFTTLKGGPLADAYLREVAARKGEEAGIDWRIHPHALRHTFATELLDETGDLALVQDALGHSKPETTRVYAKVRNGRLALAMARRKKTDHADQVAELQAQLAALQAQIAALAGEGRS